MNNSVGQFPLQAPCRRVIDFSRHFEGVLSRFCHALVATWNSSKVIEPYLTIPSNLIREVMVQASTKSDAGKTNAWRFLAHLISSNTILPHSTSCSTVARKFMLTSYHGTSGPSGCIGSGPTPTQPASGNNTTTEPVLIRLEQLSQERLTSNQIKKLTVRSLVDMFGLRTNGLSGDIRNLLNRSWNSSTWYDSVPLTECPSDRSIGVVGDERKDRHIVATPREAGLRSERRG